MAPDRSSCPESPDRSRRTFITGLGTVLATTTLSLSPLSRAAGLYGDREFDSWGYREMPSAPRFNTLAEEIEYYINDLRQIGRIAADEQTAWLVYDLTSRRYLAAINANRPYQSASMIKPFIALAFFHKVYIGQLQYTLFDRSRMEAMIQYSDNNATNYFIELLNRTSHYSGPVEAELTLKRNHPGLFRQTRIVESIPSGGRSYRNKASALDYHYFLHALWYDQFPYANELKRLMNLPNRDRIYSDAYGVARQTWVLDKTGSTARLCGDMGILIAQGRNGYRYPYIFIGIIEKARPANRYRTWVSDRGNVIREVSGLAYAHMQRLHNLV